MNYWQKIFVMSLFLGLVSCAQTFSHVSTSPHVKVYVLDCGYVEASDVSIFNPRLPKRQKKKMATPCYLVRHPKGYLLWDTGLSDELLHSKNGIKKMPNGFTFLVKRGLKAQLSELGVSLAEVDFVAFSHLHLDHTGNARYFDKAKWLLQGEEIDLAKSENAHNYGYEQNDFLHLIESQTIRLNGNHDVFGDESVILLRTPGHTPGHQSLFINLKETGPIVISGDLYHFAENEKTRGIPVWNDKSTTLKSFKWMDHFLKKHNAKLWIQHDLGQFKKTKLAPESYQ